MEQFNTLLEAAECVVTRCNSWRFATSDEKYDAKSLMRIAEVSDAENPADEDSFYVEAMFKGTKRNIESEEENPKKRAGRVSDEELFARRQGFKAL